MLQVDIVLDDLAGRGLLALLQEIAAAEFLRAESDDLGDLVHVPFQGEEALRSAEAAKSAVRRDIGRDRPGVHAKIRPPVWTASVNRGAGEHDRRKCNVRSAVNDEVDFAAEQDAVFRYRSAMSCSAGMALGCAGHVFAAVVADLDRSSGLHRQERGVRADDRREILLAPKGAASLSLDDPAFVFRQI